MSKFKCNICDRSFDTARGLQQHHSRIHVYDSSMEDVLLKDVQLHSDRRCSAPTMDISRATRTTSNPIPHAIDVPAPGSLPAVAITDRVSIRNRRSTRSSSRAVNSTQGPSVSNLTPLVPPWAPSPLSPEEFNAESSRIAEEVDTMYAHSFREVSTSREDPPAIAGFPQPVGPCKVPFVFSVEEDEKNLPLSETDKSMGLLYKIADDAGAPKYLVDEILKQLQKSNQQTGFDIYTNQYISQRRTYFPRIMKSLGIPYPEVVPITLESGRKVTVVRFDIFYHLQEHLLSRPFAELSLLDLPDPSNPFYSTPVAGNKYSSTTQSLWYKSLAQREQVNLFPRGDGILHCLSLYQDKTGTDLIQKNGGEPIVCTSMILGIGQRQSIQNHFVLAYLPCSPNESSAKKRTHRTKSSSKSLTMREYHHCLKVALEPLIALQKARPFMRFRRGKEVCNLRIICPIGTVVGDNQSQDRLCGKVDNKKQTSMRMGRCCLTTNLQSDNVPHRCDRISFSIVDRLCNAALGCFHGFSSNLAAQQYELQPAAVQPAASVSSVPLSLNLDLWYRHVQTTNSTNESLGKLLPKMRQLRESLCDNILWSVTGSHAIDNAFADLDFGPDSDIFIATQADILHTVEAGLAPVAFQAAIGPLSNTVKAKIDEAIESLFGSGRCNRSGERHRYPRISFTRGYCSLTLLSSAEKVGQLFALSLLMRTDAGRACFQSRFDLNFDQ